jgi:transcriptional regulator with GAF, ATPase, and Fis domain
VNCAAIAPELAESELFGHAEGAFTGARARSQGLFASAAGGTLFLDEVGELPLALQPKLLRALAKGEVRPVGSSETLQVQTRVIAATHRDLSRAAAEGSFRDDLLARLSGWVLSVPPLRARRDDVLALARRFLASGPGGTARAAGFDADVAEALLLHGWKYNVRELEQVLAVAAVRSGGAALTRVHLAPELSQRLEDRAFDASPAAAAPPLEALIARDVVPNKEDLERVLAHVGGNVAQAADFFGKDRRQIYRWAERLGLDPDRFRP